MSSGILCSHLLTRCCQHDLDDRFVGDVRRVADDVQHIRAAVVVPEQQQSIGQLAEAVVRCLITCKAVFDIKAWSLNCVHLVHNNILHWA